MPGRSLKDLKNAFDTVSLPILINKLERIGIRDHRSKLLSDYLTGRVQHVRLGNYISEEADVTFRVPQGSFLGPVLFLIYIICLTNLIVVNLTCPMTITLSLYLRSQLENQCSRVLNWVFLGLLLTY